MLSPQVRTHSVQEFLAEASLDSCRVKLSKTIVEIDPETLFRPAEVDYLLGDASKAKKELGWTPQITFNKLVKEMVTSDIRLYSDEKLSRSFV